MSMSIGTISFIAICGVCGKENSYSLQIKIKNEDSIRDVFCECGNRIDGEGEKEDFNMKIKMISKSKHTLEDGSWSKEKIRIYIGGNLIEEYDDNE